MSKKWTVIVLTSILLTTMLLWVLLDQNGVVILLGVAAVIAVAVWDMLVELKRAPPKRMRGVLQAVVCCLGGTAVVVYIIIYVLRGLF